MEMIQTVLLAVILIAVVAVPLVLFRLQRVRQQAEIDRLMGRIEQVVGASVKLLEVRSYCEQIGAEYRRMLDEAYKEGNRFRQDQVRKLMERLEQLKARTVDRTSKILESDAPAPQRRHRRGRRGHRPPGSGPYGQNQQQKPKPPKPPAGQPPQKPGPSGPPSGPA